MEFSPPKKQIGHNLIWIILFSAPHLSANNFTEEPKQFVPPAIRCLPARAMTLDKLNFASQRAQIIQQLGAPQSLDHYSAEDGSGIYAGEILNFQNTQIYFDSARGLQRIITSDSRFTLPLNLHIGQTLASIQSRIAVTPTRQLNRFALAVCVDETRRDMRNREVFLQFDADSHRLKSMDMMVYGP